ncbi:MAG TPA: hypothetical protein VFQ44_17370 [Streptosporangiaceae bacterium]|nr:hypothetical protein [Streptosporangiaceae bacterium]
MLTDGAGAGERVLHHLLAALDAGARVICLGVARLSEQGLVASPALLGDSLLFGFQPGADACRRVVRHLEYVVAFLPGRRCECCLRLARVIAGQLLSGEFFVEAEAGSRQKLDVPVQPYRPDLVRGQALDDVVDQEELPGRVPRDEPGASSARCRQMVRVPQRTASMIRKPAEYADRGSGRCFHRSGRAVVR